MREGQTLILVRSRHIYESLLDALYGHYIKETSLEDDGEVLHRTMLSLAGETKSVIYDERLSLARMLSWKVEKRR
jgi:hypothetical protein